MLESGVAREASAVAKKRGGLIGGSNKGSDEKILVYQSINNHIGGAEGDRTPDLRIANATLSQLSYGPALVYPFRCCDSHLGPDSGVAPEVRRASMQRVW